MHCEQSRYIGRIRVDSARAQMPWLIQLYRRIGCGASSEHIEQGLGRFVTEYRIRSFRQPFAGLDAVGDPFRANNMNYVPRAPRQNLLGL